jgi:hypothetical protein
MDAEPRNKERKAMAGGSSHVLYFVPADGTNAVQLSLRA